MHISNWFWWPLIWNSKNFAIFTHAWNQKLTCIPWFAVLVGLWMTKKKLTSVAIEPAVMLTSMTGPMYFCTVQCLAWLKLRVIFVWFWCFHMLRLIRWYICCCSFQCIVQCSDFIRGLKWMFWCFLDFTQCIWVLIWWLWIWKDCSLVGCGLAVHGAHCLLCCLLQ